MAVDPRHIGKVTPAELETMRLRDVLLRLWTLVATRFVNHADSADLRAAMDEADKVLKETSVVR